MKIALISYEYPPDTADGGIATYVAQAAKMLAARGNTVEVFAASRERDGTNNENGVLVHRTRVAQHLDFARAIVEKFVEREEKVGFDVIEGPDFQADARCVVKKCPHVPYIVKLHTPLSVSQMYEEKKTSVVTDLRMKIGKFRRGINPFTDYERENVRRADLIATPSNALGKMLVDLWNLEPQKIVHFPYPYTPSAEILKIPVGTETNRVTFLGRLECRKGVTDLAEAVPLVLKKIPQAKFRFVGRSGDAPDAKIGTRQYSGMREYLIDLLGANGDAVEFVEKVPLDAVPQIFADTDVCVFPSRFDNFPNVCLEAMSAARGVVGSTSGGMAEMLDTPEFGRLVPPNDARAIAESVIELLENPLRRMKIGSAARRKVLSEYNLQRVGEFQENFYQQAIRVRAAKNCRTTDGSRLENQSF